MVRQGKIAIDRHCVRQEKDNEGGKNEESDAQLWACTSRRAAMAWTTRGKSAVCEASRQILYSVDGS